MNNVIPGQRKVIGLPGTRVDATTPVRPAAPSMEYVVGRLQQQLPRSLDFNEVLQVFADETHHLVEFDAMSFAREDGAVGYATAPLARHKVNYRLEIAGIYLGDLTFSRRRKFENGELIRMENAITALAYPLRNALLYREALNAAHLDNLTQIGNRAAMNQALQTEMVMAERYEQEFCVILVDIDHFKRVNDQHGHLVGDKVLRHVARQLQQTLRRSDSVYRFGGEEFVVLLRKTSVMEATVIAERLRLAVECAQVRGSEGLVCATISSGIARYESGQGSQDLLERADKALYQAKQSGRNRVCTAA